METKNIVGDDYTSSVAKDMTCLYDLLLGDSCK